jgi:hypothetical protein
MTCPLSGLSWDQQRNMIDSNCTNITLDIIWSISYLICTKFSDLILLQHSADWFPLRSKMFFIISKLSFLKQNSKHGITILCVGLHLCVIPYELRNQVTYFHVTWYEWHVIGRKSNALHSSCANLWDGSDTSAIYIRVLKTSMAICTSWKYNNLLLRNFLCNVKWHHGNSTEIFFSFRFNGGN